ncbi:MAG: O-antigen ligase family protein [Opitutaceae bacterium]|nr:O-antigen ligase family protein [Opitutaceae bacterium]
METKHYIALIGLLAMGCATTLITIFSQRLRDFVFFAMVALAVLAERGSFDVNFLGEYWYRGTSRGLGISVIDVLALSVFIASQLSPRYERRPWFIPASFLLYSAYFAYCIFSATRALEWTYAIWELVNIPRAMLIMVATASFVRTSRELKLIVLGICVAVLIQAVYAVKQRLTGMFRPAGTLDHANSLSMYLCLVSPVLLAAGLSNWSKLLRWFVLGCTAVASVTVLMTLSRAGLPIFAFVMFGTATMCITWKITRRKIVVAAVVSLAVTVLLAKSWDMLVIRFGSATIKEEFVDIEGENRGIYWRWAKMIVDDDPFGVGLNNWSYAVSKTYGARVGFWYEDYDDIKVAPEKADIPSHRYAPPAHALAALTLGELGVPGLILFLIVWFRWFQMGATFLWRRLNRDPMHRLAIGFLFGTGGIFLQSVTEWTYRQPTMFLTFHLMMGALASLVYERQLARKNRADDGGEKIFHIAGVDVGVSLMGARK